MEKIAIGVPYEISIEPSIDIGKFDAELVLDKKDFQVGIELKKIKGEDNDYTFIIPSNLKTLLKKSQVKYHIFVYKENARFEVDDGDIKFIDETDFKVRVKDNAKMRPVEEEPEEKDEKKDKKDKKDDKPKKTPEPSKEAVKESAPLDPAELAEQLINKQLGEASDPKEVVDVTKPSKVSAPPATPLPKPNPTATKAENDLHKILSTIEERKQNSRRREEINKNIQKALHKKG